MFVVLVDHTVASRAGAALLGSNESNVLDDLTEILDGPTELTAEQRRAQIAAVSLALGGD